MLVAHASAIGGRSRAPHPVAAISAWEDFPGGGRVVFRPGEFRDTIPIASRLLRMKMNPLSIDHERFIVCESGGQRIGFGQIRKLSDSRDPDPTAFDARPGTASIAADVDDEAWDDLEREWDSLPKGFAGIMLPWDPSYKQLDKRAALQQAKRKARLAQAEAEAQPLWELASVYVDDTWRGRGVGSALVNRLLARHADQGRAKSDTYLLTLSPTAGWYESLGFRRVPRADVPRPMALELAAGEALSAVLGNELVCMRGGSAAGSLMRETTN